MVEIKRGPFASLYGFPTALFASTTELFGERDFTILPSGVARRIKAVHTPRMASSAFITPTTSTSSRDGILHRLHSLGPPLLTFSGNCARTATTP